MKREVKDGGNEDTEMASIQVQASQETEHYLTRPAREGENSRFKMPKLPDFVDSKDDLVAWLLRFERFDTSGWPKMVHIAVSTIDRKGVLPSFQRSRPQVMIVSKKFYKRDIT